MLRTAPRKRTIDEYACILEPETFGTAEDTPKGDDDIPRRPSVTTVGTIPLVDVDSGRVLSTRDTMTLWTTMECGSELDVAHSTESTRNHQLSHSPGAIVNLGVIARRTILGRRCFAFAFRVVGPPECSVRVSVSSLNNRISRISALAQQWTGILVVQWMSHSIGYHDVRVSINGGVPEHFQVFITQPYVYPTDEEIAFEWKRRRKLNCNPF